MLRRLFSILATAVSLQGSVESLMNPVNWKHIAKGLFENDLRNESQASLAIGEEKVVLIIEKGKKTSLTFVDDSGNRLPIGVREDLITIGGTLDLSPVDIAIILFDTNRDNVLKNLSKFNLQVPTYDGRKNEMIFKIGTKSDELPQLPLIDLKQSVSSATQQPSKARAIELSKDEAAVVEFPRNIGVEISYHRDRAIRTETKTIKLKLGDPAKFFEIWKEIYAQIALVLPRMMESNHGGAKKLYISSFPDYALYLCCHRYNPGRYNLFIFDIHSCIEQDLVEELKELETNPTEEFKRDFNRMLTEYAEKNPSFEIPEDWFYKDTIHKS